MDIINLASAAIDALEQILHIRLKGKHSFTGDSIFFAS